MIVPLLQSASVFFGSVLVWLKKSSNYGGKSSSARVHPESTGTRVLVLTTSPNLMLIPDRYVEVMRCPFFSLSSNFSLMRFSTAFACVTGNASSRVLPRKS